MRFKYCVALLLFVAVIGVVVLAVPAAAANPADSAVKAGNGGYVVTFVKSQPGTMQPMTLYNTISQGQYQWQSKLINYYTTSVNFNLYWGYPPNSLRLRIITPDGYVLGPYYDSSDGVTNGAVNINVNRAGGVAQGTWITEVYGYSVSGSQSYSIS
jgi:hypothetical protein